MWVEEFIIPKQQIYYGVPYKAESVVRQVDIVSPTFFSFIIDANIGNLIFKFIRVSNDTTTMQVYENCWDNIR